MNTPDPNAWDDPAWDDLFRHRLDNYEAEPAPDALNRILTAVNGPSPAPDRGMGGPGWLLVAVGLLLLSGVGWLISEIRSANALTATSKPIPTATHAPPAANVAGIIAKSRKRAETGTPVATPAAAGQSGAPTNVAPNVRETASSVNVASLPTASARVTTRSIPKRNVSSRSVAATEVAPTLVATTKVAETGGRSSYSSAIRRPLARSVDVASSGGAVSVVERSAYTANENPANEVIATGSVSKPALLVTTLPVRPLHLYAMRATWPQLTPLPVSAAAAVRPVRSGPTLYGALMPLFTYRQINPVASDERYVQQIQSGKALSADRVGWQFQVGAEWPLTRQLSLRTGLTYGILQQALRYNLSATTPDSVRIDVIDAQTIRVTPFRSDQAVSDVARYQYVGLSANLMWHLTAGRSWRPYLTAGTSVGGYVSPGWQTSGFVQASAGVERPLSATTWLRVEPTVQYGWNPVSDRQNLFTIRPYTYGLTVGLGFRQVGRSIR